jgi:hypothetical protein
MTFFYLMVTSILFFLLKNPLNPPFIRFKVDINQFFFNLRYKSDFSIIGRLLGIAGLYFVKNKTFTNHKIK